MIGVFKGLIVDRFWRDWDQKFKRGYSRYINPDHELVKEEAERLNINPALTDIEIANKLWNYILEEYEYKLEKRWRPPQDTIREGTGDCEDYCFLIGSLFPNFGVNEFKIIAGEAKYQNKSEFHVWMKVDGEIIDPTAEKWKVKELNYSPELTYNIKVDE